jgi:hypothetical protein
MTSSTIFDELVPMIKELQEDCEQLSKDEFENLKDEAFKEAQATGNSKVIIIMKTVFTYIENELNESVAKENVAYE